MKQEDLFIYVPLVVSTLRSFPHSWLITGFICGVTRWVSLVELQLLSDPVYLGSTSILSGVRFARFVSFCMVFFVDRCFSFSFWTLCCRFLNWQGKPPGLFRCLKTLTLEVINGDINYVRGVILVVRCQWSFNHSALQKTLEKPEGTIKMGNPKTLATLAT
jgi:hypothetical protein